MTVLSTSFFILLLLLCSTSAFAFGSSDADCDGDGISDIFCSGMACGSIDEGNPLGIPGYCDCLRSDGSTDRSECADLPTISGVSFLSSSPLWQQLNPPQQETPENPEPEHEESIRESA